MLPADEGPTHDPLPVAPPPERVRVRLEQHESNSHGWRFEVGNDTIGWIEVPTGHVDVQLDNHCPRKAVVTFFDPAVRLDHGF